MAFNFLKRLFKIKPKFNHTPETFLAMMIEMQNIGRQGDPESSSAYQLARVFIKIMKVDLRPYKDLDDLFENGKPDFTLTAMVMPNVMANQQRRELKQEIYGHDVDLGEDDILKGNTEGAKFARQIAGELQKYIRVKGEDENKKN
jgi:hypothetical protein